MGTPSRLTGWLIKLTLLLEQLRTDNSPCRFGAPRQRIAAPRLAGAMGDSPLHIIFRIYALL